jgi:hypothetical protein
VWVAIIQWWKSEKKRRGGPVPREQILQERDRIVGGNGELAPFCQVAAWWLEQRLMRMA